MNAKQIIKELRQDLSNLDQNKRISDAVLRAPRVGHSIDKKTGIAHDIAFAFFPLAGEKEPEIERRHTYIRYHQLLSKLSKAYHVQKAEDEHKRYQEEMVLDRYRKARVYGNKDIFLSLLDEPIQEPVLSPTPMPVEIAPYDELDPFFDYMQKNSPAEASCQEFTRGAYYNDGRIDMCKQVVGPNYIGNFVDSIKENPHVKHFLMGNNVADREDNKCTKAIHHHVTTNHPDIETWYLAGNCINAVGAEILADAFSHDSHCKALWLKRNPLGPEGVCHIGRMLETNESIEILDLVNVAAFDEGIYYLFNSLKKNRTLRLLYLDANGITSKGAEYIADYFNYLTENNLTGITSLFMSINRLGDTGATLIANSLRSYYPLERLELGSNRIQAIGLKSLLEAIVNHPKLIFLGIGLYKSTSDMKELPNYFDEGGSLIAQFVNDNKSVQILDIQDTNIGPESMNAILKAYQSNKTMLYLYFGQYGYCTPKAVREKMWDCMIRNIQGWNENLDLDTFKSEHLRFIKHTDRVRHIDSIYRNNM